MGLTRRRNRRQGNLQLALDVGLPVVLLLTLGVVYVIDRPGDEEPVVNTVSDEPVPGGPAPVRRLRLGVTPDVPEFDDMGGLLDSLGEGYRHVPFPLDDFRDFSKIAEYDVIFLTCSGVPRSWLNERIGQGEREGTEVFTANEEVLKEVEQNLQRFVKQGKTLYVSDLHYDLVAEAFPEFAHRAQAGKGRVQDVKAEIVDPGLRELLGKELGLRFDQPGWRPAAFRGNSLVEYMRGTFETEDGRSQAAPLLVKFPVGDGTVIFTSFHNEKQQSETELKLLRYLVFSAVTAEVDTMVNKRMLRGGFAPAKKNLFSASAGAKTVTGTYQSSKRGHLQFVLGFQEQGARLKLTVVGPDGSKQEKEGTSTLTIDVDDAAVGAWEYTVTAVSLPNENFPFTVTVGAK